MLGDEDGARAAALLGVTPAGTFEAGTSTLQLRADPDDPSWWSDTRDRLLAARAQRPQPSRDDKVVTAWNGLAIAALADAGVLLDRPDLVAAAEVRRGFVLATHVVDGRAAPHLASRAVGPAPAVLDDHANLAEGLLALHQATGTRAGGTPRIPARPGARGFVDEDGTLHDTAHDARALFARPAGRTDNAEPCGASALAGALLTHAALTGSARHREAAAGAVDACGPVALQDPRFAGWALAVAEAALAGPLQVAVVGEGPDAAALAAAARASTSPGLVVMVGMPDAPGVPCSPTVRSSRGAAAAYVCRGFVCERRRATPRRCVPRSALAGAGATR